MSPYTLDDFDYHLPEKLIAQSPAGPRDHARLLVFDRSTGSIVDDYFYNLPDYLPANTTLVVNNSRVEKCRLLFEEGAKELFVVNTVNDRTIEALVRPGKRFRMGKKVHLADGLEAEVIGISDDGIRTLVLNRPLDDPELDPYRATPFPPYIKQNESLAEEYQTVFALDPGSKAAPTAGLHFTPELIKRLKNSDIGWEELTLHVGLGTFSPVKTDNLDEHVMHTENFTLPVDVANQLGRAAHITAVGTTSVRVLESVSLNDISNRSNSGSGRSDNESDRSGRLGSEIGRSDSESGISGSFGNESDRSFKAGSGETNIFIRPGYSFQAVDAMITNFHLPKSTLLMLIAAFTGYEAMHEIYRHAIKEEYRFYSFGDGMLIL